MPSESAQGLCLARLERRGGVTKCSSCHRDFPKKSRTLTIQRSKLPCASGRAASLLESRFLFFEAKIEDVRCLQFLEVMAV